MNLKKILGTGVLGTWGVPKSHLPRTQHLLWAPVWVCVPFSPLWIQLPAIGLGRQQKKVQVFRTLPSIWETRWSAVFHLWLIVLAIVTLGLVLRAAAQFWLSADTDSGRWQVMTPPPLWNVWVWFQASGFGLLWALRGEPVARRVGYSSWLPLAILLIRPCLYDSYIPFSIFLSWTAKCQR